MSQSLCVQQVKCFSFCEGQRFLGRVNRFTDKYTQSCSYGMHRNRFFFCLSPWNQLHFHFVCTDVTTTLQQQYLIRSEVQIRFYLHIGDISGFLRAGRGGANWWRHWPRPITLQSAKFHCRGCTTSTVMAEKSEDIVFKKVRKEMFPFCCHYFPDGPLPLI